MNTRFWLMALTAVAITVSARAELRVPAFTAYFEPDTGEAEVSELRGIVGWKNPAQKVLWFGEIKTPGQLECSVALRLPAGTETRLRLTVAGTSREAVAKGAGDKLVTCVVRLFRPRNCRLSEVHARIA